MNDSLRQSGAELVSCEVSEQLSAAVGQREDEPDGARLVGAVILMTKAVFECPAAHRLAFTDSFQKHRVLVLFRDARESQRAPANGPGGH
jgi:hypothetical protein